MPAKQIADETQAPAPAPFVPPIPTPPLEQFEFSDEPGALQAAVAPLVRIYGSIPFSVIKGMFILQTELVSASAKKSGTNTHTRSSYAKIDDVLDVVMPAAVKAGLVIIQPPLDNAPKGTAGVRTIIASVETGEQYAFDTVVPITKSDAHSIAGGHTYAARYALVRTFMLQTEDDDGNTASGKGQAAFTPPNLPYNPPPPAAPAQGPYPPRPGS